MNGRAVPTQKPRNKLHNKPPASRTTDEGRSKPVVFRNIYIMDGRSRAVCNLKQHARNG